MQRDTGSARGTVPASTAPAPRTVAPGPSTPGAATAATAATAVTTSRSTAADQRATSADRTGGGPRDAGAQGGDLDLEDLARRLLDPVARLLRAELRRGRDRAGRTFDGRR
ncbi:hypothetical protein ACFVGM_21440 [Kitasatospora purpeofusca]|uniref:hypothetical protein n=1 Tax=Kitasatospora purpeofusca TaxID=67352 RepID=UPI0036866783